MPRPLRIGQVLIGVGAMVGTAAAVGLAVGFEPASLPSALLNVAVYKLTFVAAIGLLVAGAIVNRYTRKRDRPPMLDRGELPPQEIKTRARVDDEV